MLIFSILIVFTTLYVLISKRLISLPLESETYSHEALKHMDFLRDSYHSWLAGGGIFYCYGFSYQEQFPSTSQPTTLNFHFCDLSKYDTHHWHWSCMEKYT